MNWAAAPWLGLLTVLGYLVFLAVATRVWRNRGEFSVRYHDEVSFCRRNFSRYTPAGPFYALREESRFKAIPVSFVRSITHFPRNRINGPAILLFLGFLLFVLDFFV